MARKSFGAPSARSRPAGGASAPSSADMRREAWAGPERLGPQYARAMMSPQQLEAKVLGIVMALRAGTPIEDDLVECKSQWPDTQRWRQLAGSANRAAGEPILWIIGLDEGTGETRSLGDTDPASWWAQLSKGFTEIAPELVRHLVVHVGLGEAVVALMFSTDRTPYVVRCPGGSPEREVPIRDGTRTRSAYRHELLRMLVPNVATPPAALLNADLAANFNQARQTRPALPDADPVEIPESFEVSGHVQAFIEPSMGHYAFLPEHGMRCWLRPDESVEVIACQVVFFGHSQKQPDPLGITYRGDGILAEGPGHFGVSIRASLDPEAKEAVRSVRDWSLTIEFDVASTQRPIRLIAQLRQAPTKQRTALSWHEMVGAWSTSRDTDPIDKIQPFPQ